MGNSDALRDVLFAPMFSPEEAQDFITNLSLNSVKIFTDGSHMNMDMENHIPASTGYGVCGYFTSNEVACFPPVPGALLGDEPAFVAEIVAIIVALEEMLPRLVEWRSMGIEQVVIFSDSRVWVDSLNRMSTARAHRHLYQHAQALLRDCRQILNVFVCWVKAHAGIAGNEEADRLATSGRMNYMPVDIGWIREGPEPALELSVGMQVAGALIDFLKVTRDAKRAVNCPKR